MNIEIQHSCGIKELTFLHDQSHFQRDLFREKSFTEDGNNHSGSQISAASPNFTALCPKVYVYDFTYQPTEVSIQKQDKCTGMLFLVTGY